MSLTGLFIAFFLTIHLAGNLQLLLPETIAHEQYNWYSHFLSKNILIKVVAIFMYFTLLLHMFEALQITLHNQKANGSSYQKDKRGEMSSWISRNMGILGSLILVFLIVHFKDFWYVYKFGQTEYMTADGHKDLYVMVIESFKQLWYVILYVVAILVLGFHLWHGVKSAFRTLGVYNEKYIRWVKYLGYFFAVAMTFGYAIIPIILYLRNI